MHQNVFTFIVPYIRSGILDLRRNLPSISLGTLDLYNEQTLQVTKDFITTLAELGGNVLIEGNHFSEIIGCPTVHTSLVHVSVLET